VVDACSLRFNVSNSGFGDVAWNDWTQASSGSASDIVVYMGR